VLVSDVPEVRQQAYDVALAEVSRLTVYLPEWLYQLRAVLAATLLARAGRAPIGAVPIGGWADELWSLKPIVCDAMLRTYVPRQRGERVPYKMIVGIGLSSARYTLADLVAAHGWGTVVADLSPWRSRPVAAFERPWWIWFEERRR
jgi:hypothetical protein